jgi:hypothetical protein
MGLLADDKSCEEMKQWREIIEKYNKALGQEPEYELIGVDKDADGGLILKLRKRVSPSPK